MAGTLPLGMMRIERQCKVHGRRTNIVLEATYWDALEKAADELGRPVREVVTEVCGEACGANEGEPFSRALRLWVVDFFQQKLERAERAREG